MKLKSFVKLKSYAKINLSLDVTSKLDNGYHNLRTIMQTVEIYDDIVIKKIKKGIEVTTNRPYIPVNEKNLAYKAAKIMIDKYNIKEGVKIDIFKRIPVAAGMGGGSSNAATVIKGMNEIFDLNASDTQLQEIGATIGADVAFFIKGGTALCEGIGDILTYIPLFNNQILVVIKPPFGISTKQIFEKINVEKIKNHPKIDDMVDAIKNNNIYQVAPLMKNVLENIALHKYKTLVNIKEDFKDSGAIGTLMSGSGSTVFGIYDDMSLAQNMFLKYVNRYDEVFITRTI